MNTLLITFLLIAGLDNQFRPGRTRGHGRLEALGRRVTLIDSAGVRRGTSPLCPSCFADCRKSRRERTGWQISHRLTRPRAAFQCADRGRGLPTDDRARVDPLKVPLNRCCPRLTSTSSIPSAAPARGRA